MSAPAPLRYISGGITYPITGGLTPTGTAAADTATLQAALDDGGHVSLEPYSTWTITDTLTIGDDTILDMNGALLIAETGLNSHVIENTDRVNGNSGIMLRGGRIDANKANQTGDNFSVLDFEKITACRFIDLDVQGGKRTKLFNSGGTNGEGLLLRDSTFCEIVGGRFHDNMYDGIKFRKVSHSTVTGVICYENGRSGIQISSPVDGGVNPDTTTTEGSYHNTFTNIVVYHSTGSPASGSPTTSGFYIHPGGWNIISGLSVYGTRQGIGFWGESFDNVFSGGTLRTRWTDRAAIDLEYAGADRNTFSHFRIEPLSGTGGKHIKAVTGATGNRAYGCHMTSSGATFTNSLVAGNDLVNCYMDGAAIT